MTLVLLAAWPATASAVLVRNYAAWSVGGAANAFTGTLDLGVHGFPDARFSSNARVFTTARSATLTSATPFGAAFGTSSGRQYASIGATFGNVGPTSTTFTFDAPTPASGWGLALGDLDAESVRISATGVDGAPVAVDDLGFAGVFNSVSGGTDLPDWDAATGTLAGNPCPAAPAPPDCDTDGATGWFRPGVPLRSLTLHFSVQDGAPRYQLWFAANSTAVRGTFSHVVSTELPTPSATVQLLDGDGAVVAELIADGPTFTFPPVPAGPDYRVEVLVPEGWHNTAPTVASVSTATGDPAPVAIHLEPMPPATTTLPTTSTVPDRPVIVQPDAIERPDRSSSGRGAHPAPNPPGPTVGGAALGAGDRAPRTLRFTG